MIGQSSYVVLRNIHVSCFPTPSQLFPPLVFSLLKSIYIYIYIYILLSKEKPRGGNNWERVGKHDTWILTHGYDTYIYIMLRILRRMLI